MINCFSHSHGHFSLTQPFFRALVISLGLCMTLLTHPIDSAAADAATALASSAPQHNNTHYLFICRSPVCT